VVIFRLFFSPLQTREAHELAWSQMGSGALLPGGGAGSLAIGGWLLHLARMPTRQIVRRSSGLFFLTSAINVITLATAGLLLVLGIAEGPHDVLRAGMPIIAAVTASAVVLGLPPIMRRISGGHPPGAWLSDIGSGIPAARDALTRPSWRLLGALGYLLFDIGALWATFAAVGPLPPLAPIVVAYLVGYLANVIPIPGGIGVLDAGLVGALALYGLPVTHAAAAVLLYHAVAFWIPALGGTLAYARLRPRLAGPRLMHDTFHEPLISAHPRAASAGSWHRTDHANAPRRGFDRPLGASDEVSGGEGVAGAGRVHSDDRGRRIEALGEPRAPRAELDHPGGVEVGHRRPLGLGRECQIGAEGLQAPGELRRSDDLDVVS
jgi:uncharacterized membrane protein YbhN (UPF0104 family)